MIDDLRVYAQSMGVPADTIAFNPLLARGLDYYTGPIFETVIAQSGIGSISGGGRFDNLISVLGGPDLRASGSSFGLERVITVMGLMGIEIPVKTAAPVFVTLFKLDDLELLKYSFRVASAIRLDGIPVEVYNGANAKLGKQIEIANRKKAQVVLIMGDTELSQQKVTIKVLSNGEQFQVDLVELTSKLQSLIS
jgi:histidyl-tRNA synthetase